MNSLNDLDGRGVNSAGGNCGTSSGSSGAETGDDSKLRRAAGVVGGEKNILSKNYLDNKKLAGITEKGSSGGSFEGGQLRVGHEDSTPTTAGCSSNSSAQGNGSTTPLESTSRGLSCNSTKTSQAGAASHQNSKQESSVCSSGENASDRGALRDIVRVHIANLVPVAALNATDRVVENVILQFLCTRELSCRRCIDFRDSKGCEYYFSGCEY